MNKHLMALVKSSAIYGLGSALQKFILLFLLPVLTKYLSPVQRVVSASPVRKGDGRKSARGGACKYHSVQVPLQIHSASDHV
jgi:hypothetical protein